MKTLIAAVMVVALTLNGFAMGAPSRKNAERWKQERKAEAKKVEALQKQIKALNARISGQNLAAAEKRLEEAAVENAKNLIGALTKDTGEKAKEYLKAGKKLANSHGDALKAINDQLDAELISTRDTLEKELNQSLREMKALDKAIHAYDRAREEAREQAREYRERFIRDHDRNGDGKVESGFDFPDRVGGRDSSRVS